VLDIIGYDAMSKIVAGIHVDNGSRTRRMTDLLDLMRRHAPPDRANRIDEVIEKWTKGVGLVKP
jgi:hypothetical protein